MRSASRILVAVLVVAGLAPAALAFRAILAEGLARQAAPAAMAAIAVGASILPVLGISGLFGNRPWAIALGLWTWPPVLLWALPAFTRPLPALAEAVPPPESPPAPAAVAAAPTGDGAPVAYQGEGRTLRIPVVFEGFGATTAIPWMLFDTGASYTTLDRTTLSRLGVAIPPGAPVIRTQTASGPQSSPLVLVDRVQVGGYVVEGVTVAVCDSCRIDEASGLLGLNVSGQFKVTLEPEKHRMVLAPGGGVPDRRLDVEPWLELTGEIRALGDTRQATVTVNNRSARRVDEAVVEVGCEAERHRVRVRAIPPRGSASAEATLPAGPGCPAWKLDVAQAVW